MVLRRLFIAALALACLAPAHAQTSQTRAANQSQISSSITDNTVGAITPQTMRTVLLNLAASMATLLDINAFTQSPTAPTGTPCSDSTTTVATDAFVQCAITAKGNPTSTPQGRLTLQSGHPVQNADQTSVATVYYAPYIGNTVPILNASGAIAPTQFTSSSTDQVGLSLSLNAGVQLSQNLYDVYAGLNATTPTLCTGPAWSSHAAGSSSRGAAVDIALVNGVWVNNLSLTCSFGSSTITCPAKQCTWLGTLFASSNGHTSMTLKPAAADGGSNNVVGLCNGYNRKHLTAKNQDSAASNTTPSLTGGEWTVEVDPPGQLADAQNSHGAGANNRINFIDCTGTQEFTATFRESGAPGSANANALTVGVAMDGTAGFSGCAGAGCRLDQIASATVSAGGAAQGQFTPYPILGFRFAQAMEESEATHPFTVFGNDFEMLTVEIDE